MHIHYVHIVNKFFEETESICVRQKKNKENAE